MDTSCNFLSQQFSNVDRHPSKNREKKECMKVLVNFTLSLGRAIHEEVGVSRKITDIRDTLQYTMNGAAGMWLKQGSIQKATRVVLNKLISPQPMQKVISNGKLFKYENIFC
jgi:hypothetical protein